jgi:hypothetical protein
MLLVEVSRNRTAGLLNAIVMKDFGNIGYACKTFEFVAVFLNLIGNTLPKFPGKLDFFDAFYLLVSDGSVSMQAPFPGQTTGAENRNSPARDSK